MSILGNREGIDYILDNINNIGARHLNRSNLHLNQYGTPKLAGNMINYIKNVKYLTLNLMFQTISVVSCHKTAASNMFGC